MNINEVEKLIKSELLTCKHLLFVDIILRGRGYFGYVFKLKYLPYVIKIIPVEDTNREYEYEMAKEVYNLYKTKHKINTIIKPYFTFICDTEESKIFKRLEPLLIKRGISRNAFYSKNSLKIKKYTHIIVYDWINGGDLYNFLNNNMIEESEFIRILLTIFCTLKVLKDATDGMFLHYDLHIANILIKINKQNVDFVYNFEKDKIKVAFKNKYIPIIADFSHSVIREKKNSLHDSAFTEYHDIFKFSNNLLSHINLIANSKKIIDFLEFIVPEYFRYSRIIVENRYVVRGFNILLHSKDMPFKKSVEEILLHPIFSDYVNNK